MPSRYHLRHYQPHHFYHIVHSSPFLPLFPEDQDYQFFTLTLTYYLRHPHARPLTYLSKVQKPYSRTTISPHLSTSLQLVAYTLLNNHFHLLLYYANPSSSPTNLMRRLSITYSLYYRKKYPTTLPLFPQKYKSLLIPTPTPLIYLSHFLHTHSPSHSSLPAYTKTPNPLPFVHPNLILNLSPFQSSPNPHQKYTRFLKEPLPSTFDTSLTLCS